MVNKPFVQVVRISRVITTIHFTHEDVCKIKFHAAKYGILRGRFENYGQVCSSHPLYAVPFTSRCIAPCPTTSDRSRMYGTLSPNQSSPCVTGDQISLDQSIGYVFRIYGEEYIRIYRPSPHRIKLIRAIRLCKTPYLGGQTIKCKDCGKELKIYHSCGHSQCQICQSIKRALWQDRLSKKLFEVPYIHTVFTP